MEPSVPPDFSDLVIEIQGEGIPPDTVAVRGYLGPTDLFTRVNEVLNRFGKNPIPNADVLDINATGNGPWRIYTSARLDRYVEIEDWLVCVVRLFPEISSDRQEAQTVWLRRFYPPNHPKEYHPIPYSVVTVNALTTATGFVSGELVEDFMTRSESRNIVWDEQEFGVTTGKPSGKPCF